MAPPTEGVRRPPCCRPPPCRGCLSQVIAIMLRDLACAGSSAGRNEKSYKILRYSVPTRFWFASQVENFRTLPEEVLAINVLDLGVRNFVRLASTNKVMKLILSLLSERFELRALMEHPWGVLAAQRLGINTSLLIMREAYWLRSPMLRVLIRKFGDKPAALSLP